MTTLNNTFTGLQALALAASHLAAYIEKAKQKVTDTGRDSLAHIMYALAHFKVSYDKQSDSMKVKQSNILGTLLRDLEKLLNIDLGVHLTPEQLAFVKFGTEGVKVFKLLKSLGYNEFKIEFWEYLVAEMSDETVCMYGV